MTPLTLVTPRIANQPLVGAPHVYAEPRRAVSLAARADQYALVCSSLLSAFALPRARASNRLKPRESLEFPRAPGHPAQCRPATRIHRDGGCIHCGKE